MLEQKWYFNLQLFRKTLPSCLLSLFRLQWMSNWQKYRTATLVSYKHFIWSRKWWNPARGCWTGDKQIPKIGENRTQWFPMFGGQLPLYFHFPIISVTLPLQWCSRNFPCFRKRSHFFPKIGRNLMLHPNFPRISCFCNIFVFWVSNNIPIISQNTHVFPILSQNGKFKFFPVYASMNSFSVDVFVTQDMTCFGLSFFLIVMCSQLVQVICLPLFGETILS